MVPYTLLPEERWHLVRLIMEELRPHTGVMQPPVKKYENSDFMVQSRVPVLFSTAEGRAKAVRMAARVVWHALRVRTTWNVGSSFDDFVAKVLPPASLLTRNLPMRTFECDLEEYRAAQATYKERGEKGVACGLTAPRTGNYWLFNENGRCVYNQLSAAAEWIRYLRRLCDDRGFDLTEWWTPPSMDSLGTREYWMPGGGNMVMY